MADVFISYKSERRPAARHLASIIEAHGFSVWFDYDLIPGKNFGRRIEAELREAKAVIVLWCSLSVQSEWVQDEADLAKELGSFVPARIEPCDPPLGFRRDDFVDIAAWDGDPSTRNLDRLIDRIEALVGREAVLSRRALIELHTSWATLGRPTLSRFALGQPREIADEDRRLPSVEHAAAAGSEPKGTSTAPPAPTARAASDAAADWRAHDLDNCDDPGLLKAFAAKWASADPVWAYKAQQKGAAVEAEAQRRAAREAQEAERRATQEVDARLRAEGEQVARERPVEMIERYLGEGRIAVNLSDGAGIRVAWIKPGAGEIIQDIWESGGKRLTSPEMVVVPAGEFMMGSNHFDSEKPPHKVTIKAPFAVGRFTVTFDDWDEALTAGGVMHRPETDWGRGRQPVMRVSWQDAKTYCQWLSSVTGMAYRLLSEAEWEYAARAGASTPFWWGAEISTEQANFDGNHTYGAGKKGEWRQRTMPVDSFAANPWGLYQVHGNVWEWCEDNWHPNYQAAPTDGSVWSVGDSSLRVLRGGSWVDYPTGLRSANRVGYSPVNRSDDVGFRVARTL